MAPAPTGSFISVPDPFSPVPLFPRDLPLFLPNQYRPYPKRAKTITPRGTPKPIPIFADWLRPLGGWVDEAEVAVAPLADAGLEETPDGVTLVVEICVLITVDVAELID